MVTRTKKPTAAAKPATKRASSIPSSTVSSSPKKTIGAAKQANVKMLYDAAGSGRRMRGWNPPAVGPNRAMVGNERMRSRARDSTRNDWGGEAAVQKWATTLVGIGITPRFKNVKSKTRKAAITKLYNKWAKMADADGVLGVYGMQTLAVRAFFEAGECFIRARPRDNLDIYPVNVQFQLLESEMVPLLDADTYQGMPVGNVIRSGIEFNNYGRRIAYWFYKQHPGDNGGNVVDPGALVRVSASLVSHFFIPKRIGQIRGVSGMAPILARLRSSGDYEDAVLERQKLANLFVAFIKKALPEFNTLDVNHLTGEAQAYSEDGLDSLAAPKPIIPMEPGATIELADGESMEFANPPEAGTMFSEYMRTTGLGTSAGMGIPYELFAGDIQNISDRTLRVLINEFHRLAEQYQWQGVIPMVCQFMIDKWVDAGVLDGLIGVNEAENVRDVEHAPHGWAYIHPVQDVQGKVLAMTNGLRSRSSVIAETGDDPEAVDDERAADQKREKELDLFVDPNAAANTAAIKPDDEGDPEPAQKPANGR